MSGQSEEVLTILAINVIVAYGAFLPMAAGQINLGIAGFMAIGAYAASYFSNTYGVSPWLAIFVGAAAAAMIALAVARPVLRTRGIYLALVTFGLGEVVQATFLNLDVVGGASGYHVVDYISAVGVFGFGLAVAVLMMLLFGTRFGLNVAALHDDEAVAEVFGLHVRGFQIGAFVLGALLAGLGGALYGFHLGVLEPQHFGVLLSVYVALYVLLGGVRTVIGPIVGAGIFTLMPEFLRGIDEWRYVVFAVLIIVLMVFRPNGLVTQGLIEGISGLWRRRSASEAT
jgi:branched-chain amino acid transport system permease protein